MPIYEYRCQNCRKTFQFLVRSVADHQVPPCPRCHGTAMHRLFSLFASPKSEESRLDSLADPGSIPDFDENDPRAMARWMRKMSGEVGEDMGPEFHEMLGRLEAGEDPEKIEEEMGDVLGEGAEGEGGGLGAGGSDDTLYDA